MEIKGGYPMKIDSLPNGSYRIWLTDADMHRWGLRFETMGAGDTATETAITRLVQLLDRRGTSAVAERVTVEALPIEGGCVLLFTPKGERLTAPTPLPQIYALGGAGEVLCLGRALQNARRLPPASLYAWGEQYRLIVYPDLYTPRPSRLLSEFGHRVAQGAAAAAFTEEHGRAVTVGNALHRLREGCADR